MFKVKTALLAALLATSVSVMAQDEQVADTTVVTGLGKATAENITYGIIGASVVAAIVTNMDGDTAPDLPPPPPPPLKCNGNDPLVNGVCTGSREEVVVRQIVTGTGTGTATATATTTGTAIVTFTYAPTAG